MRGCACRGDTAGFVHMDCLTEFAMSKEASGCPHALYKGWNQCGNCEQEFTGALMIQLGRRCWRRHRDGESLRNAMFSRESLASSLECRNEHDAAYDLLNEVSKWSTETEKTSLHVEMKLNRATVLIEKDQLLEALGLQRAAIPGAKECCTAFPGSYYRTLLDITRVLNDLGRYQESLATATDLVAFTKANCEEEIKVMGAREAYASACVHLERVEESKTIFADLLAT